MIASKKGSTVLVDGDKMPGAKWFPDARLNFAENLLRRGDQGDAFVFWDERGFQRRVSYSNLTSDVSRAAQALAQLGLRPGDRAAAFIPNMPETGMLALAALSQGIVWSSCSPDFGVERRARPLQPDRAEGPVRRRRLPLCRARVRRARARGRDRRRSAEPAQDRGGAAPAGAA